MERQDMLKTSQDLDDDFLRHQLGLEVKKQRLTPYDLIEQPNFQPWQRTTIIQWIESVVTVYDSTRESLFHAVNLLDRYLAQCTLNRNELILVGVASLAIALKYTETQETKLNVTEFSKLTRVTFSPEQITDMEERMTRTLECEMGAPPSAYGFVSHWAKMANASNEVKELALAFCEFSLIPSCFGVYKASVVAASAIHLTSTLTDFIIERCPTLKLLIKDSNREVKDCVADFIDICIPINFTDQQGRKRVSLVFAPTYLPFFDRRNATISVEGTEKETGITMPLPVDSTCDI